jgi:tetraacyldisaccharide 4'-kinase
MSWLTQTWYQIHPIRWLLLPFSLIYQLIIALRILCYRIGLFKRYHLPVPVIVVGNITVGGTGKTPTVIWLAKQLQQAGYQPGIISRGYGGKAEKYPQWVEADSDPTIVGDEPVIISRQTACPMAVSPNRVEAARLLIDNKNCDIIISDDGLQHYALARDIEMVIVDGLRFFGNHLCLPAGPLREPLVRLGRADYVVLNGGPKESQYKMLLNPGQVINVADPTITRSINEFEEKKVHGIAAIGHPDRFFSYLTSHRLKLTTHHFSDHHQFTAEDLAFDDGLDIIMTEKDAVKCQPFATNRMWYIPVQAAISGDLEHAIINQLTGKTAHG